MHDLVFCYNKGCAQKYNPEENSEDSCRYHPGEPVFHDAKKKWSCCNKYSTDFSEFLSIKGCTVGKHNNVPPQNTVKEQKKSDIPVKPVPVPTPKMEKPTVFQRPSSTEPTCDIPVEIASNLKSALEALSLDPSFKRMQDVTVGNNEGIPLPGKNCKNTGCKQVYTGTCSDNELCLYHPGVAVFHEGMKYWSCCNQKTSDFESFVKQVGCTTGRHNWTVEDVKSLQPNTNCRFDWYQLGNGSVTLTIYAKNIWPETVSFKANQVRLHVSLKFGIDYQIFERDFNLYGPIDPTQSIVKLMPLKAEIILKKSELIAWPTFEWEQSTNSKMDVNA